jgi:hypothetical protein
MHAPSVNATSSNTILVMTSLTRTCSILTEFLSTMDTDALPGSRGRQMMMKKLRLYLWWKGKLSQRKQDGKKKKIAMPDTTRNNFDKYGDLSDISEALKKKDREKAEKSNVGGMLEEVHLLVHHQQVERRMPYPQSQSRKTSNWMRYRMRRHLSPYRLSTTSTNWIPDCCE